MASFLVETYVPGAQAQDPRVAGRRMRDAARRLSREGISVRYVRTTLPGDETLPRPRGGFEGRGRRCVVVAGLERARIVALE